MIAFRWMLLLLLFAVASAVSAESITTTTLPSGTIVVRHESPSAKGDMVLIPGLGCAGAVWDSTVERFGARYRCHVFTLAGFGGVPGRALPFVATRQADVVGYLREHGIEKPVFVGHSLGAMLSLRIAADHPELPRAVVAVDGLPSLGAVMFEHADATQREFAARMTRTQMTSSTIEMYRHQATQTARGWLDDERRVQQVVEWMIASDRTTVGNAIFELLTTDDRPRMKNVAAPVLLFGSFNRKMERFTKRERVIELYRAQVAEIPDHTVLFPDDAGHFLMFDVPEWLWSEMERFLNEKGA